MVDQTQKSDLWTPRGTKDTQKLYADWADTYEADLIAKEYATPARIAAAVETLDQDRTCAILDFGCGTGMSGAALANVGFSTIDGTDITPEMLAYAQKKQAYRKLWLGTPGELDFETGAYDVIVACGVISLGAAPPDMLGALLDNLAIGGHLAFSYNDPTIADSAYGDELDRHIASGLAVQVFRQHGPHLNKAVTGSDVIILRRA